MAPDDASALERRRALNLVDAQAVIEAIWIAYETQVWLAGRTNQDLHLSDASQTLRVRASHIDNALHLSVMQLRQPPAHVTLGAGRRYLANSRALARLMPRI